jgi:hypothetical protein
MAVKGSAGALGWRPEYLEELENLITRTNEVVYHGFCLARFIFISELERDDSFTIEDYISDDFFREILLSLTSSNRRDPRKETKKKFRELIQNNIGNYMEASAFVPVQIINFDQIAAYESTKMTTAYLNNIENQFGNFIRRSINRALDVKQRSKTIRSTLKHQGRNSHF